MVVGFGFTKPSLSVVFVVDRIIAMLCYALDVMLDVCNNKSINQSIQRTKRCSIAFYLPEIGRQLDDYASLCLDRRLYL